MQHDPPRMPPQDEVAKQRLGIKRQQRVVEIEEGVAHGGEENLAKIKKLAWKDTPQHLDDSTRTPSRSIHYGSG